MLTSSPQDKIKLYDANGNVVINGAERCLMGNWMVDGTFSAEDGSWEMEAVSGNGVATFYNASEPTKNVAVGYIAYNGYWGSLVTGGDGAVFGHAQDIDVIFVRNGTPRISLGDDHVAIAGGHIFNTDGSGSLADEKIVWSALGGASFADEKITFSEDGSGTLAEGAIAWNAGGTLTKIADTNPVDDGTYTVGLGVTTNGTITTKGGVIVAVQQAT